MAFGLQNSLMPWLFDREIRPCNRLQHPCSGEWSRAGRDSISGVPAMENFSCPAPPLALSYSMGAGNGRYLSVADEEGFMNIFHTTRNLARIIDGGARDVLSARWPAHSNAIFDARWIKDDTHMLTASGDQTIRLWDVETRVGLLTMKGHLGSVKCISVNPYQSDLFVSGSRDGNVYFWDTRSSTKSQGASSGASHLFVTKIVNAHSAQVATKSSRRKGFNSRSSVTSVLYLNDDRLVATSGANDGIIKYWDTRNLREPVARTPSEVAETSNRGKTGHRLHGIAGLSQDPSGNRIIASCVDSKIYMFDVLKPDKPALKTFSGHRVNSFYIKAVFSPDGSHILSGSSDSHAYIWQVDGDGDRPIVLADHAQEVTAVAWCTADFAELATSSDDFTVRVWRLKKPGFVSRRDHRNFGGIFSRSISGYRRNPDFSPCRVGCKFANSSSQFSPQIIRSSTDCDSSSASGKDGRKGMDAEDSTTRYSVDMVPPNRILQDKHIICTDGFGRISPSKSTPCKRPANVLEVDAGERMSSESPSVLNPPTSIPRRRRTIPDFFNPL